MRIIFATTNQNKLAEVREIFQETVQSVVSLKDLGLKVDVEETGKTFLENAEIKAQAIYHYMNGIKDVHISNASGSAEVLPGDIILADDSGLCIDYLGGKPGIYSARFMGEDTSYEIKNQALIEELSGVPEEKRGARFVCAMCAVLEDGRKLTTEGLFEGIIAQKPEGEHGFGYDPILYLKEYGKTSAQLTMDEKNEISHRGKALRQIRELIRKEAVQ